MTIELILIGSLVAAFVVLMGIALAVDRRRIKQVEGFKTGDYAAVESQIVTDILNNVNNYNMPRAFADTKSFTCATCCCHVLDFEHKTVNILRRMKAEARNKIIQLMKSAGILGKSFDEYNFYAYRSFPSANTELDFQYLVGTCHGCKRYVADFQISGGKCDELPKRAESADVA